MGGGMSGGSLDYVYQRVQDAADSVEKRAENGLQKAFANHLHKVADALKDLEWHYSCDTQNPEPETVKALVNNDEVMKALTGDASKLIEELKRYSND